MLRNEVTVKDIDKKYEHPLAEIVQIASQFKAEILLEYDKYRINAKSIMGIIAFKRGISGSAMGSAATSEITKVVTSSFISSSPICRFPIIFIQTARKKYKIKVLMKMEAIKSPP